MTRRPIRAAGLLVIVATLAACAGPTVTAPPPATDRSTTPALSTPAPSVDPPADPSGSSPASAIAVDEGLLEGLPAQVAGIALVSDPETAAGIAADPGLAPVASGIAVALAVGPGASGGEDLAVVSVIQLRPDVFDDTFFRSWRDSYDAAACSAAGGVEGNAQAEIGGHDTYIGSCVQGAFTYHVYLADRNVVVSVTSVGERRLGEQVVAGLDE